MGAGEVVERALWQHAERATAAEDYLRHGIDRAIAAGNHDDALLLLCPCQRFAGNIVEPARLLDHGQLVIAADGSQSVLDDIARIPGVMTAGAGIEDDVKSGAWIDGSGSGGRHARSATSRRRRYRYPWHDAYRG